VRLFFRCGQNCKKVDVKYFLTEYNQRKLDNEVTELEMIIVGDSFPHEIRVHFDKKCTLLAKRKGSVLTIELEDLWATKDFTFHIVYKDKSIYCCSQCYSTKYSERDFKNYEKQAEEKMKLEAERWARKRMGLD